MHGYLRLLLFSIYYCSYSIIVDNGMSSSPSDNRSMQLPYSVCYDRLTDSSKREKVGDGWVLTPILHSSEMPIISQNAMLYIFIFKVIIKHIDGSCFIYQCNHVCSCLVCIHATEWWSVVIIISTVEPIQIDHRKRTYISFEYTILTRTETMCLFVCLSTRFIVDNVSRGHQ